MADSINRSDEGTHREVTMILETQASVATIDSEMSQAAKHWHNPAIDAPFDGLGLAAKGQIIVREVRAYIKHAINTQNGIDAAAAAADSEAFNGD